MDLFIYAWHTVPAKRINDHDKVLMYGIDRANATHIVNVCDVFPQLYVGVQAAGSDISRLRAKLETSKTFSRCEDRWVPLIDKTHASPAIVHTLEGVVSTTLYYAPSKRCMARLRFKNEENRRALINTLNFDREGKYTALREHVYEHNVSSQLQFVTSKGIRFSGWVHIAQFTTTSVGHRTKQIHVSPLAVDDHSVPLFRIMAFDIEAYSIDRSKMPDASKPSDAVFQISAYTSEEEQVLFALDGCDADGLPGIELRSFDTEPKLLAAFLAYIREMRVNVVTGWNTFGFDWEYILCRCALFGVSTTGSSFNGVSQSSTASVRWSSSGAGVVDIQYLKMPGIINMDTMKIFKDMFKRSSYKLDSVAADFVGDHKDPITVSDIFDGYETRRDTTSTLYTDVGLYCVKDSALVHVLAHKVTALIYLIELSRECSVSIDTIHIAGQQQRVFSKMYQTCSTRGIVLNYPKAMHVRVGTRWVSANHHRENVLAEKIKLAKRKIVDDCDAAIDSLDFAYEPEEFDENDLVAAKYEGACVLEPVPGLYHNVLQYDFDSLYPSLLMAYNICYSTYLGTEPPAMPPQMYHTVVWTSAKGGAKNVHHFLKEPEGIVPKLLRDLLSARKAVKKILKTTELYTVQYNVLDKRQQALKVCANSIYGVLGVQKHGMLPLNEGASSCTALGRMSLGIAVAKFQELGATVVYGDTDSCYVTFPGIAADNFPALWARATSTETALKACFPIPVNMSLEGEIYETIIFFKKKTYVANKVLVEKTASGVVEFKPVPPTQDLMLKGVVLVKRDRPDVCKLLFKQTIIQIIEKVPYDTVVANLAAEIRRISQNTMRIPPLSFCKSVQVKDAKHYKIRALPENPVSRAKRLRDLELPDTTTEECEAYKRTCLPGHILASVKMMERGQQIRAGDRISTLIVRGAPKQRQQDRTVDLDYFLESRTNPALPQFSVDTDYYINSIVNPLSDIFYTVYRVEKSMFKAWVKEVSTKRGASPTLHKTAEDKANAVVGTDGRTRVLTQSKLSFC